MSTLCKCGCGNPAPIAPHWNWRGGVYTDNYGYVHEFSPGHPYKRKSGYVRQHRLVLEKYLGRFLCPDEIPHHVDGVRNNNTIENIELCLGSVHSSFHNKGNKNSLGRKHSTESKDKMSHLALIREAKKREQSKTMLGPSVSRKCRYCKKLDDPINMHIHLKSRSAYHRSCKNEHERIRKSKQKENTI